jgi:DNA topoisomerase-1
MMQKIPSRSKKLKADHFLKCATPDCDTVMFWNATRKAYELPYAQRATDPQSITEHLCPVCSAYLERHHYQKEGKDKVMLRCSVPENRRKKCKEVAYFQTKNGGFWSPKFGNLKEG